MQSANEVALRDVPFVVAEEALLAAASVVLEPHGWRVPFEKWERERASVGTPADHENSNMRSDAIS